MKLIKTFYFFILISSILINCVSKGDKSYYNSNESSAANLYKNKYLFLFPNMDDLYYLDKLSIIDSCILLDNKILQFYFDKANVLIYLKRYNDANLNLNIYLNKQYSEKWDSYAWRTKGEIYEKQGNVDSARIFYKKALQLADSNYKSKSSSKYSTFINKMLILCLLDLKDYALSEIDEFKIKYHNQYRLDTTYLNEIYKFNKQEYFKIHYP